MGNGAVVFPYRWRDDRAVDFAAAVQAVLAEPRGTVSGYSLSPASLLSIQPATRIVLPSPNGATLTLAARPTPVFAGCLRNAEAVAAQKVGPKIAVIAAGERWPGGHGLRPAVEDLIGAGAIISCLNGRLSPEAASAAAAFCDAKPALSEFIHQCSSGKELIEHGFAGDVSLAAELNVSECVPRLNGESYARDSNLSHRSAST